ncbi:unnamed protein product [Urochloa humidicola]
MEFGGDGSSLGWAGVWSALASLLFLWSMVQEHLPFRLEDHLAAVARRVVAAVSPYVTITIDEHAGDSFGRSEAYRAAESYLSATCAERATRLRAEVPDGSDRVSLAVDDHVEVADEFRGATLWWRKTKMARRSNVMMMAWSPREEERRAYRLTFRRRHRALVEAAYLPHVLAEGRAVAVRNRQRRLFTNTNAAAGADWGGDDGPRAWSHVKLEHPSTFATLAMDPARKQEILDDLDMFRDGREYYASVGKPWKRGYLLFGPPGTGKSTLIAAMANYLDYDVYDLELTAVKSNTELRKLFIETTGKSIIVIEDIDCSIDLTGKRKKQKKDKKKKMPWEADDDKDGKVTLSGLLNFIDGLWSACGGERIIIFTTNHKEKLDPALIRRGRMDMHIEMSYCCFQGFKVLAKNYLGVADHDLFADIRRLLEEVNMTPADVAENLMPRSKKKDVDACLAKLVKALKEAALAKPQLPPNKAEDKDEEGTDEDEDDDSDDDSSTTSSDYDSNKEEENNKKKNTHKKKKR